MAREFPYESHAHTDFSANLRHNYFINYKDFGYTFSPRLRQCSASRTSLKFTNFCISWLLGAQQPEPSSKTFRRTRAFKAKPLRSPACTSARRHG